MCVGVGGGPGFGGVGGGESLYGGRYKGAIRIGTLFHPHIYESPKFSDRHV